MRRSRRQFLGDLTVALAGTLVPALGFPGSHHAAAGRGTLPLLSAAATAPPAGWSRLVQSELGIAFDYPAQWTVRVLENGLAGVSEGRDGLSGARAYGQLFTVNEGTSSGTLIYVLATNLGQTIDRFRIVEAVRLSFKPDVSALRFTFPYVDGLRKGTLTVSVNKGGAVLLAFDAPAAVYAARVHALTDVIATFKWFESSLRLSESVERQERAYSVMLPDGWRPSLKVIRPHVDAGFVAKATDPAGNIAIEVHRPRMPSFITPDPFLTQGGLPEGTWYPLGARWGMEPLLVYRYLPGKDYIRWLMLPALTQTRPGLQLVGLGERPDYALDPDAAGARRLGGSAARAEAEYTWTKVDGTRMRGRVVASTIRSPSPQPGRGSSIWTAPQVLLAEAPERQFNTAVAAMVTMNATLKIDPKWFAGEIKGSRERWRIIRETERILWTKYQEAVQHRQDVALAAAEKWSSYVRHSFSGRSDFGSHIPYGEDTILTADGQVVKVVELGGRTVAQWNHENPNGYLKKAW